MARTRKAKAPSTSGAEAPVETGSQAAYERFLDRAWALEARDVLPFRADPKLAYHNVADGVRAVLPLEGELEKDLKRVDFRALAELPDLALGVVFAALKVSGAQEEAGEVAKLLRDARAKRDLLLSTAEALAKAGLLPAGEVKKIREGKGQIDTASDCVALAALFRKHAAALRGKTAVTKADIDAADDLGSRLLRVLKSKRVKVKPAAPAARVDATDARDRMWTLLVVGHRELRRVGMWRWMEAVDEHVPALQAGRSARKKKGGE